jgi:hypothetical protein
MRRWKSAALLVLMCLGIASLSGCVVVHHRDGGITFRPMR